MLEAINSSGKAFIIHTELGGRFTMRLAIGGTHTQVTHPVCAGPVNPCAQVPWQQSPESQVLNAAGHVAGEAHPAGVGRDQREDDRAARGRADGRRTARDERTCSLTHKFRKDRHLAPCDRPVILHCKRKTGTSTDEVADYRRRSHHERIS